MTLKDLSQRRKVFKMTRVKNKIIFLHTMLVCMDSSITETETLNHLMHPAKGNEQYDQIKVWKS